MSKVSGFKDLSGDCQKFLVSNLRLHVGATLAAKTEVGHFVEEMERVVAGVCQVNPVQHPLLMTVKMRPKDAEKEGGDDALTDLLLKYGQSSCYDTFPEVLRVFVVTPNDLNLSAAGFPPSLHLMSSRSNPLKNSTS